MRVWINATNNVVWNVDTDKELVYLTFEDKIYWTHSLHDRILWGGAYGGVWLVLE